MTFSDISFLLTTASGPANRRRIFDYILTTF